MAKMTEKEAHNAGQHDGSKPTRDGGVMDLVLGLSTFGIARVGSNNYNPPDDDDLKQAYNDGYRHAKSQK